MPGVTEEEITGSTRTDPPVYALVMEVTSARQRRQGTEGRVTAARHAAGQPAGQGPEAGGSHQQPHRARIRPRGGVRQTLAGGNESYILPYAGRSTPTCSASCPIWSTAASRCCGRLTWIPPGPAANNRKAKCLRPQQLRQGRRGWMELSIRGSGSSHMATTPTYSASASEGLTNASGMASRYSATESLPLRSRPTAVASRVL